MRTHIDTLHLVLHDDGDEKEWLDDLYAAFHHVGRLDFEERKHGKNHYEHGAVLLCNGAVFAELCWGGTHQKDTVLVIIKGVGCGMVHDWAPAVEYLRHLQKAKITRIDVALDVFSGELRLIDVWNLRNTNSEWRFTPGKAPNFLPVGDMLHAGEKGRTLYIGTRDSDVFCRVYEKGIELFGHLATGGDVRNHIVSIDGGPSFRIGDYVRFEVEFKAKTTKLPLEVLLIPDKLIAGSYPYVKRWLKATPYKRVRTEHVVMTDLDAILKQVGKQYGPSLRSALSIYNELELLQKIVADHPNSALTSKGLKLAKKTDAPVVVNGETGEITSTKGSMKWQNQ